MSILTDSITTCLNSFYDTMSTTVVFRKMTKLTGPNPALNPVDGAVTVSSNASSGATSITLTAPAGNWFLRVGDKFTIAGNATIYTVQAQKVASSGTFASVSISPALAANASAGAAVTFTWSNDYTVSAVVWPYDDKLIDGTTITVRDLRCYMQSVDQSGVTYPDPTNLDKIRINGVFRPIGIIAGVYSGDAVTVWDAQAKG